MDWSSLIKSNTDALIVSTDTRNLPEGCVFFALKGETFDGNRFAEQALRNGAEIAIVSNPDIYHSIVEQFGNHRAILLTTEDTQRGGVVGLQNLARAWRRHLALPVIAITGTNGKTTTKELTAAVLRTQYRVHATQGNLNNSIGVPLTLLQTNRHHQLAIVEMGASHPGDIKELMEVAEPDYGLITNVGKAHLQGFGSFQGVMRTKQELYDYLVERQGTVIRNADNPYLQQMLSDAKGNQQVKEVLYHTIPMPSDTHLVGSYNAENIAAALCIGELFGVGKTRAMQAVRQYQPANDRSMFVTTPRNRLIVDAYNANPTSMKAAIQSLAENPAPKEQQLLILGDMLELGEQSLSLHQEIVDTLSRLGYQQVILVGNEFAKTNNPYITMPAVQTLTDYLRQNPVQGKLILLKGSHGMHLEKLKDLL